MAKEDGADRALGLSNCPCPICIDKRALASRLADMSAAVDKVVLADSPRGAPAKWTGEAIRALGFNGLGDMLSQTDEMVGIAEQAEIRGDWVACKHGSR